MRAGISLLGGPKTIALSTPGGHLRLTGRGFLAMEAENRGIIKAGEGIYRRRVWGASGGGGPGRREREDMFRDAADVDGDASTLASESSFVCWRLLASLFR